MKPKMKKKEKPNTKQDKSKEEHQTLRV